MDDFERKSPRNALTLYIKMYSKQRSQAKKGSCLITEAAKSWLSLSEIEKLEFSNKFKECKLLLRKKVANQLKNIKPYMKKKKEINYTNPASNSCEELENTSNTNFDCEHNIISENIKENNIFTASTEQSFKHEASDTDENKNINIPSEDVLLEPNPPALLSGQQLFNLIHKEDNRTWAELLPAQRRQYQAAVLTIKKNYLKDYKTYLESLSIANLLEHYKNVKNELG